MDSLINKDLRLEVLDMICRSSEGHIPSAFSIIDIVEYVYTNVLRNKNLNFDDSNRDYFILSKGHGAAALYAVLYKHGLLDRDQINSYGLLHSQLGGHPDTKKLPWVEASTGSLGHGMPISVGIALGLKIQGMKNKVISLVGDGECHEGTIWEAANIAANQNLSNLVVIVDWNQSAQQLLKKENLELKWAAFGWNVLLADGHSNQSLEEAFGRIRLFLNNLPTVIIAKTTKGKGSSLIEGHGIWHHKIPTDSERKIIESQLNE